MPDELVERLERASAKAGRSLSAEICARIEASFAQEAMDKATLDFLNGVALMPAEIEREVGAAWHKHAGAHEVFKQAILSRLEELKPEGSSAFGERPHATVFEEDSLLSDGLPFPAQLGSIIEYRLRRQPDFTTSPTRQLMEDEHRRAKLYRLGMAQAAQRGKPAPTILGGAEKKRGK
jgi:hypothetical protein